MFPDKQKAPFSIRGQDARQVAMEIEACFRDIEPLTDKMTACFTAVANCIGLDCHDPLFMVGIRIADDIDHGIGAGGSNSYHNRQHFCEVLLSACQLGQRAGLSPREQAQLAFAALIHDFHHDGRGNRGVAFKLELQSLEKAKRYCNNIAIAEDDWQRIVAMVLCTDIMNGTPYARQAHAFHTAAGELDDAPHPELAPLASDARLCMQCLLLGESDLLASFGLGAASGTATEEKLAKEVGKPTSPENKLFFLENIFKDFVISSFFRTNLQATRESIQKILVEQKIPANPYDA